MLEHANGIVACHACTSLVDRLSPARAIHRRRRRQRKADPDSSPSIIKKKKTRVPRAADTCHPPAHLYSRLPGNDALAILRVRVQLCLSLVT